MSNKKLLTPVETTILAHAFVKNASVMDALQQYLSTPEGQRAVAGAGIGAGAGGLAGLIGGGGMGTAIGGALLGGGAGAAGGHYAPQIQALFNKLFGGGGSTEDIKPPEGTIQARPDQLTNGAAGLQGLPQLAQMLMGEGARAGDMNPSGGRVPGPGVTRLNTLPPTINPGPAGSKPFTVSDINGLIRAGNMSFPPAPMTINRAPAF